MAFLLRAGHGKAARSKDYRDLTSTQARALVRASVLAASNSDNQGRPIEVALDDSRSVKIKTDWPV